MNGGNVFIVCLIPRCDRICSDVFDETFVVIMGWNVTPSGSGTERPNDGTIVAIFDVEKTGSKKCFRSVENHDSVLSGCTLQGKWWGLGLDAEPTSKDGMTHA